MNWRRYLPALSRPAWALIVALAAYSPVALLFAFLLPGWTGLLLSMALGGWAGYRALENFDRLQPYLKLPIKGDAP
jgi:hypothetical protein